LSEPQDDDTPPDRVLTERDTAILRELSKDPQRSARELRDILEEDHGIDVSHVTVSESIRTMREDGVFREAILPNEEYYSFAFLEFKFDPTHFEQGWRDAMEHIRDDEHTLFYFLSDGEYQWKAVMMFPDAETHSRWIHEFYKDHGDVIQELRNSVIHNVLEFRSAPQVFDHLSEDGG
jgi:DNA-binding Lrp family transcriptional regulator